VWEVFSLLRSLLLGCSFFHISAFRTYVLLVFSLSSYAIVPAFFFFFLFCICSVGRVVFVHCSKGSPATGLDFSIVSVRTWVYRDYLWTLVVSVVLGVRMYVDSL